MQTLQYAKEIRSIQKQQGKSIYITVVKDPNTPIDITNAEDILCVSFQQPDYCLRHPGSGFIISGQWNNFKNEIPLSAPDLIDEILDDYHQCGYSLVYEPSLHEQLINEYQRRKNNSDSAV